MKNYFIETYGIERYNKLKENENELYKYNWYANDYKIIEKLLTLKNEQTFWNDVRKFTKRIYSDRNISRWQTLAELRYMQLAE